MNGQKGSNYLWTRKARREATVNSRNIVSMRSWLLGITDPVHWMDVRNSNQKPNKEIYCWLFWTLVGAIFFLGKTAVYVDFLPAFIFWSFPLYFHICRRNCVKAVVYSLSIKWNSIILGGPAHGIATKNCTPNTVRVTFCLYKTGTWLCHNPIEFS